VDNGNVHRAAAKIIVSKSRAARGSVCSTPDMGVILWGENRLYLVSVSLLKVIIPKNVNDNEECTRRGQLR